MQKVQENDDPLNAFVTSVTDMIGKEIAVLKQDGLTAPSDLSCLATRADTKLVELHAAMGDLRTAMSAAGPSAGVGAAAPPALLFSHELEELKRTLASHEQIPRGGAIQAQGSPLSSLREWQKRAFVVVGVFV